MEDIHLEGGTVLGTSEAGECDVLAVVKRLGGAAGRCGLALHAGRRAAAVPSGLVEQR